MRARRIFSTALAAITLAATPLTDTHAGERRFAPGFSFGGVGGKYSLASLRGQPIVLLIASGAKSKSLRAQLKSLTNIYHDCASRGAVFVAAIADGGAVPSDIPFVLASNPGAVASAYGMKGDFLIAIIGRDGNYDLTDTKPIPGARVFEVIKNNGDVQEKARREIPSGR